MTLPENALDLMTPLAVKRKYNREDWTYRKRHLPPRARTRTVPEGYWYHGKSPFEYTDQRGRKVLVQPGGRVSNRQYQNLRYQAAGWKSKSQYESVRYISSLEKPGKGAKRRGLPHQVAGFNYFAQQAADEHGLSLSKVKRIDSEFSSKFAAALNAGFPSDPDGPFADLLVYVGLRTDRDDWQIEETNIQASGRSAP